MVSKLMHAQVVMLVICYSDEVFVANVWGTKWQLWSKFSKVSFGEIL